MALRFIIGRAGKGKTRQCLAEIAQKLQAKQEGPLILLVPEQATFHMEKTLLEYCGLEGTMQAQVLSFKRLAWRVLQETGGGSDPVITETGKALILRRLLEKNRPNIRAFARVIESPGFLRNLMEVIGEFKLYNIPVDKLAECLGKLEDGDLYGKIADLILIYQEYEAYLANRYLDTEDFLHKLAQKLPLSAFLTKAEVWLDGFNGFTPQEYEVIRQLLFKVPQVHITLCLDLTQEAGEREETHLLYPVWETYRKLQKISREAGCPSQDVLVVDGECHRFSGRKELAFLEESFFQDNPVYQGTSSGLKVVAAANRRAELEGVAREILTLCRDRGYQFQDMAVLFRDYSPYERLLPTVFADYKIPYFLDKKRPLSHHPLLDLLQGALEVLEYGWNYEPLFRYLKTDLVSLSRQEVDLLENYCLAHGIRGSRWIDGKPWRYVRRYTLQEEAGEVSGAEEKTLRRINRAREKAVSALFRLEQKTKTTDNVRAYALGVYELLEDLGVPEKMQYWSSKAEREGKLEEAQIHHQIWLKTVELLEQLAEVLGSQEMNLGEFSRLVKSGLESIELGLIPPGLDQVLVGTVDRSRNPNMKAVFILGVNEGVFPAGAAEEGLFSDAQRKALAALEIELAPTSEKRLFSEQFLVYQALTRASDFLYVSYPLADEEGRALKPSYLPGYLMKVFPEGLTAEEEDEKDLLAHPLPVLGLLASRLRQAAEGIPVSPLWWEVYNWYLKGEEWQRPLKLIMAGLFEKYQAETLPPRLVKKLYGSRLLVSVSKLEKFRACPFSYFLNYGLKLKEREEYKLKPPDLGQFLHAALENIYAVLQQKGLNLCDLNQKQLAEVVEEIVEGLVPQLQNELLLSTSRYRYLTRKLKRTVLRAASVLREHEVRGTFRPVGLEISFGEKGKLPGLQFKLNNGSVIVLQGRIDRVDSAQGQKGFYLRVIDYKSGNPGLSLWEIYYGLKLQLLAYLDVVLTHIPGQISKEALPGGVLYFKIRDPLISNDGPLAPEELEKKILQNLKMNGYVLKDTEAVSLMDKEIDGYSALVPVALKKDGQFYQNSENLLTLEEFEKLKNHLEKVVTEIGEEILSGCVAVHPYYYKGKSPCRYCVYKPVCRFDTAIPGQTYRNLPEREAGEVWYEIGIRKEGDADEHVD